MTTHKRTILLLGSAGQLGRELPACLSANGQIVRCARSGFDVACDLSDPSAVDGLLNTVKPNHIVNAAAFTSVDVAETERAQAQRINTDLPGQLADYLKPRGGWLVHYSTDYVFAGNASKPYRESDTPDPINTYGASKLAGENRIRAADINHLIFRTAWVYGRYGKNFVKTILGLAAEKDSLSIVDDQIGRPTSAQFLAEASCAALSSVLNEKPTASGTYHLTANGEPVSWHGFAQHFLNWKHAQDSSVDLAKALPVPSSEFPTPAKRPGYSVLNNSLFEQTFDLTVTDWKTQLNETLSSFS